MSRQVRSLKSTRMVLLLIAFAIVFGFGYAPNASAFVRVSAGVGYNSGGYDLLSEYGDWIDLAPYGVVWVPYVDESWSPFSDGQWVWSSYGWSWDSYEPFGELVYHYGYWYFDNDIGWFWVPGDEWSPARVQWTWYGDYCGWAPLPPPNYYWPDPWIGWHHPIWIVVYVGDFCDDHVGHYRIDYDHHRDIWGNHRGVMRGAPDYKRIEGVTHRDIAVRDVVKRPMDIRRDQIRPTDRQTFLRDRSVNRERVVERERTVARDRSTTERDRAVVRDRGTAARDRSTATRERSIVRDRQSRGSTGDVRSTRGTVDRSKRTAMTPNDVRARRDAAIQRNASTPRREAAAPRTYQNARREAATPRTYQNARREAVAPRSDRTARREVAAPRTSPQREQRSAVTRSSERPSSRSERQYVAPRQSSESRQSAQVSRRSEAPSRSAQPARSAEKSSSSDRSVKAKHRN